MAQAARTQQASHGLLSFLNSDGRPHPVENTLAAVAVLLGAVALLTGLLTQFEVADLHLVASWVGLAGVVAAGWGQYVSVTLGERFLLIIGLGAAAFGLLLGFAYGGPFGGVLG
jgi:hypothetical protein